MVGIAAGALLMGPSGVLSGAGAAAATVADPTVLTAAAAVVVEAERGAVLGAMVFDMVKTYRCHK